MQSGNFQTLFEHMEWADALTWKAVLGLHNAHEDSRLRDVLYHLHSVQWIYLQVWRGEPLRLPDLKDFADLAALEERARSYYRELPAFVRTLETGMLQRTVEFPWSAEVVKRLGSAGPATLGESILQVVLHSTYHRGQIASRVREAGGEPQTTDLIAWLWKERPEPEWP